MTYAQFHLAFTLPLLALLASIQARPLGGVGARTALGWLGAIVVLAVAYTTPWDNYLVYRGVWTYPPEAVWATIGYVPVEEYAFFVIQSLIGGLLYFLLRGRGWFESLSRPAPRSFRMGLSGLWFLVAITGIALLVHPSDHALYLGLILAWASPVLAGMALVGADKIWRERRRIAWTTTALSLYLWAIDRIAIGLGIWDIEDRYSLGLDPLGLPVEEAVFFTMTTLLCVVGLAMLLPDRAVVRNTSALT